MSTIVFCDRQLAFSRIYRRYSIELLAIVCWMHLSCYFMAVASNYYHNNLHYSRCVNNCLYRTHSTAGVSEKKRILKLLAHKSISFSIISNRFIHLLRIDVPREELASLINTINFMANVHVVY